MVIPALAYDPLDWVPRTPTFLRAVIERARHDIGRVIEQPLGSNRSPVIDAYLRRAGVPESVILAGQGYWCGAAVGEWWSFAGLEVPPGYASCDAWMRWAKETGRWHTEPALGAAVLYGVPGDARHIELIIRTHVGHEPFVSSIGGNTTIEGAAFSKSRNGITVAQKEVNEKDPVLGYCWPFPPTVGSPRAA